MKLAFAFLNYVVDPAFLLKAADIKLNKGLDEAPIDIVGFYTPSNYNEVPSFLQLDASSLQETSSAEGEISSAGRLTVSGKLVNLNNLESFKTLDRTAVLDAESRALWTRFTSSSSDPSAACPWSSFVLYLYCDLKTYKFYHWMCAPILQPPETFTLAEGPKPELAAGIMELAARLAEAASGRGESGAFPALSAWFLAPRATSPHAAWDLLSNRTPNSLASALGVPIDEVVLCVADPSNLPENPGWPLRNLLLHASLHPDLAGRALTVLCVRESRGRMDPARSLVLRVQLQDEAAVRSWKPLGWLTNDAGRMGPRMADLGPSFSPQALADQAAALNLRLMRWREAPELQLDAISRQRCLIVGSGTLGCSVSRNLVAWGVRHVTFVDSGKVSYSNPARQNLFTFEDCVNGGQPKAECAARRLREVLPSVRTEGVQLTIPMPGHLPPDSPVIARSYQEAAARLESLVRDHDVIFLLTDTRESRWLPTLLGALHDKLVITSALGFDSFVVMRHGASPFEAAAPSSSSTAKPTPRKGCYFCNDVVAPRDSTRDRSMDQQCTVTRPGLSPIASALAVELMVAVVQQQEDQRTGTPTPSTSRFGGPVPHMIRGNMGGWNLTVMEGHSYGQCTACSAAVCGAYRDLGWEGFLKNALQDPAHLEELTGLKALHDQMAADEALLEGLEEEGESEGGSISKKQEADVEDDDWTEL